jgi:hypothetical protein
MLMLSCADSIAYTFSNRSGGLVTFSFPISTWPDTRRDQLALGFHTTQSDAVLIRIASGSSTDYIELELVRSIGFFCNELLIKRSDREYLYDFFDSITCDSQGQGSTYIVNELLALSWSRGVCVGGETRFSPFTNWRFFGLIIFEVSKILVA